MGESYLCSPQVPVFYPTYEEFKDFRKYITSIETKAREWGICKIVPPKSWRNGQPKLMEIINKVCQNELSDSCIEKPDAEGKALLDKIIISKPLEQQFEGKNGCYNQLNIVSRRKFSVYSFKKFAESDPQMSPKIKVEDTSSSFPWSKYEQLEKLYWKTLTFSPTFYGADMCGTLFPASVTDWNIGRLDNLLADLAFKIPGVNSPYLYFGMWKSSFAWHVEVWTVRNIGS